MMPEEPGTWPGHEIILSGSAIRDSAGTGRHHSGSQQTLEALSPQGPHPAPLGLAGGSVTARQCWPRTGSPVHLLSLSPAHGNWASVPQFPHLWRLGEVLPSDA